jgi:hypothetical protein
MAARRISGSLLIGVIAALVEVAMFPRGYSYPKMLLYAAAPLVIWWYVKRPSWGRMSALAVFVQVAFLFRHVSFVIVALATVAVTIVGATVENLNRASLFGGLRRMPERFAERSAELHDRFKERQMPTGPVDILVPFFRYVDRCTQPEHRLLVPGFIPEVPVYAHRPFAAGRSTILPGYLDSPAERRQLLAIVERQVVPFVVVTSRSKQAVWAAYPDLAVFIETEFSRLVRRRPKRRVDVFASRTLPTGGTEDATDGRASNEEARRRTHKNPCLRALPETYGPANASKQRLRNHPRRQDVKRPVSTSSRHSESGSISNAQAT